MNQKEYVELFNYNYVHRSKIFTNEIKLSDSKKERTRQSNDIEVAFKWLELYNKP